MLVVGQCQLGFWLSPTSPALFHQHQGGPGLIPACRPLQALTAFVLRLPGCVSFHAAALVLVLSFQSRRRLRCAWSFSLSVLSLNRYMPETHRTPFVHFEPCFKPLVFLLQGWVLLQLIWLSVSQHNINLYVRFELTGKIIRMCSSLSCSSCYQL